MRSLRYALARTAQRGGVCGRVGASPFLNLLKHGRTIRRCAFSEMRPSNGVADEKQHQFM